MSRFAVTDLPAIQAIGPRLDISGLLLSGVVMAFLVLYSVPALP